MTEIFFYHMTESRLDQALPILLEKCLSRGWNVVVQTANEKQRDQLNSHLWTHQNDSFLPHGADGGTVTASEQPIWITTATDNPNNAAIRFMVEGALNDDLSGYERAIYMFDGHDNEAVEAARGRWKIEKDTGHDLTYWQQNDLGQWQKKA